MALRKQSGFTLLELLTVIAIIGVLASLIFPAISATRAKVAQTNCMDNMNAIYTAFRMFHQDEHRYPEFLAGPVERAADGSVISIDQSTGIVNGRAVSLYPEYLKSVLSLQCPLYLLNKPEKRPVPLPIKEDPVKDPLYAYWQSIQAPGEKPPSSRQLIRPETQYELYFWDTYDSQFPEGAAEREVHYTPLWYYVELTSNPTYAENNPDYSRQLAWKEPPADTIITWCSLHRDTNVLRVEGEDVIYRIEDESRDLVLVLDGSVKRVKSLEMDPWATGWKAPIPP